MDPLLAQSLASSIDPKSLASLQNRNGDPAVAKAVAGQFGAFLMQNMMQDADGTALGMTDGTGGAAVNSMFASTMSRFAMSGDKLGLADMIYRSSTGKNQQPAPPAVTAATQATAAPSPSAANGTSVSAHGSGISLTPYWESHGHRPLGPAISHITVPTDAPGSVKAAAGQGSSGKAEVHATTVPAAATRSVAGRTAVAVPAAPVVKTQAAAPVPHSDHSFWNWLGLPSLFHLIFADGETGKQTPKETGPASTPAPTAAAVNAAAPPASDGPDAAPFGLPWTHRKVMPEAGMSAPRVASNATGAGGGTVSAAADFAHALGPSIAQAAQRLGVSPRVLLAQAALETGWGRAVVGNNIFGIKAGAAWPGATVTARTHEMEGGRLVEHQGAFRSYDNVGQAVDDYVALVSASSRYRSALGAGDDPTAYAQALTAGGYATDRNYIAKLTAVADSDTMSDAIGSLSVDAPGQLVSAHG